MEDEQEPKYESNLSAVLFEMGSYRECIQAIQRAWVRMERISGAPSSGGALAPKLATRFTKAAYMGGLQMDESWDPIVCFIREQCEDRTEIQQLWARSQQGERMLKSDSESLSRAQNSPIFKCVSRTTLRSQI